jgi:excisionase family DNA binding protein
MGSVFDWISTERAADALGVTIRSVREYIRSGKLASRKDGHHTLVSRTDVKDMIEAKKRGRGVAVNAMTVARLTAKVEVMEKQLETVMRLLDIRYEPLELNDEDMGSLYLMAEHYTKTPWAPHEEAMWSDVFVRLRIEDIERMVEVVGDPDPWRPLYALAKAMFGHPHNTDNKLVLSAGVNNIERIAFAWSQRVEGKKGGDIQKLIRKDDVLVRRMGKKMERIFAKQQNAGLGGE